MMEDLVLPTFSIKLKTPKCIKNAFLKFFLKINSFYILQSKSQTV